jgi:hypothetical protein
LIRIIDFNVEIFSFSVKEVTHNTTNMGNCIGRDDANDNISSNGHMNNGGAHYPYSPPGTSSQSAVLTIAGGQPHFRGIKDNAMPSTASSHLINNNGEFCF